MTLPAATPTLPLWPEGTLTAYAALAGAPLALLAVVAAPMILALYAVVFHPAWGLAAAALGLAAGGAAAATAETGPVGQGS